MGEKRPFQILSIDGGGIKGLYSAVILADFEERYGRLYKHFNLICGTSTGGIIALALAAGIPAKEIVNLYVKHGPVIFPYKSRIWRGIQMIKQIFYSSKYSDENLRSALESVFGEKRIKDCKTYVLIPTSNITKGTPCIIKTDHSDELGRDSNHLLVDVALATAAAPTYFPIQSIPTMMDNPDDQFADGGLFGNNPSLYGIQEAYRFFIGKENHNYENFSLLSVSTLHQNFGFQRILENRHLSLARWGPKLISLMIDLQTISTHFHIEYLNKSLNGHYVRIESEPLTEKESKLISLDMACEESINLLIKKGHETSSKWIDDPRLQRFFELDNQQTKLRGEPVGTMQ
jgi:uncharacterized protein